MKLEFSGRIFEKYSNFKFRKNPSTGRVGVRGVPCGEAEAFLNFAKVSKNSIFSRHSEFLCFVWTSEKKQGLSRCIA